MADRRVVITGIGAVTPIGNTAPEFWDGLEAGKCGIDFITKFDTTDFKCKLAAEVKGLDIDRFIDKKAQRRMDRYCQFGMIAAMEAYEDSGIAGTMAPEDFAVTVGSGVGGLYTWQEEVRKLIERGPSRVSPFLVPMMIANILAGEIAIKYHCHGPCHAEVTACSTGNDNIGEAYRLIQRGGAVCAFAGAAEAAVVELSIAGFSNMTALTQSTDPARASIPFDRDRDGFVMGEGAGILILEEYEHAIARGAKIYAELAGYGATCEGYHITLSEPTGASARAAMLQAVKEAGIAPGDVGYINAHGTSTPPNDAAETAAIKAAFGESAYDIPVSSTKSMTGHLLGASGAIEAVACILAMKHSFLPPTIGLQNPQEGLDLDYVQGKGRSAEINYALSNSFGFGGHNSTLLFGKM